MPRRPAGGWTLLELLLATVIGALIIALLYSIYHTTMRTVEGQEVRRNSVDQAAAILDQLSTDLARAWLPGDEEDGVFVLEQNGNRTGLTLGFCTLAPSASETDVRWADTGFVTYQARREGAALALTRAYRPLAGPGWDDDPESNVLADAVSTFTMEVFDGQEWVEEFTSQEAKALPRAARVRLTMEDGKGLENTVETEVFIPTGAIILSDIQRVSATPTNQPAPAP